VWAFGFASLLWAITVPWWTFPFDAFGSLEHLLLGLGVIVVGTLLPFVLIVAAVRHIPASRAAVVATLEPVLGAVFAWLLKGEALATVQIVGGALVLAAVAWVQLQRPDVAAEAVPPRATAAHR
jgi:drug/metabolite transporter (DMT)-like permease